ncbi:MAG TPA: TonB-dependent receptor [Bryobacteraceae bacterium]|nr:TonB-dependent receptor [Bryobacteraceae bacterium]
MPIAGQQPAAAPKDKPETVPQRAESSRRIDLNLLGVTDTANGESRRNENIHFNLVDNNALKELNVRLGVTATIIQEFRPERGYFGAEFGNAPTAVLYVPPFKAPAWHGSLFERHQNSIFSARSFFQVGGVQPAHENNYGFTLAGPLWRGAFLQLDGSQDKSRGSVNGNVLVPMADERTPLTNDPATRAIVERFLAAFPAELPNRTDVNPRALNTNSPQTIDDNNLGARLDQNWGARDRLSLRYQWLTQHVQAFELVAGQNPDTDTRSHSARITWERQWNARTLTNLSAGFDRIGNLLVSAPGAVGPTVSVAGLEMLGPLAGIPINRKQNLYRYGGQARRLAGNHEWTAGFNLLRRQLNGLESDTHRGYISFTADFGRDAITNLRMGTPTQNIQAIGNITRGFRNWDMQYYAGDRWRVSPDLTLNFSLRYAPVTTPAEVNHFNTIPYPCDCNNFAPSAGFAWRLPGAWGVLRGAYGLQYGEIYPVTFQQVRFDPPWNHKIVVTAPSLVDPLTSLTQEGQAPDARSTVYLLAPNLVAPYAHQYNFSWEAKLSGAWNLQVGYVGSREHKLLSMWYLNRAHPVPGIPLTTATINQRRANQDLADIRWVLNGSDGYFDAARVTLVVPRWHGVSMDVSYWYSKAMDLGSAYSNTAYDADSRLGRSQSEFETHSDMKALSDFDQPHSFLWRISYAMPSFSRVLGGWRLSAVTLLKSGTPFNVITGSDSPGYGNVDGNGSDRPNILDPSILGRTIGNPDTSMSLMPRSAFSFIAPGAEAGDIGRNTFRKGGIGNVNAAVSRTWRIRSEKQMTFRAESINFFNTPQFAAPGLELAQPNFGQITNTLNDGRAFRFLVQFAF